MVSGWRVSTVLKSLGFAVEQTWVWFPICSTPACSVLRFAHLVPWSTNEITKGFSAHVASVHSCPVSDCWSSSRDDNDNGNNVYSKPHGMGAKPADMGAGPGMGLFQGTSAPLHHLLKGVIMTLTPRLLVPLSPCFRGCRSWCGLDFFPAAFLWDRVELTLVFSFTKYEFSLLSVPACLFGANWFWPVYPTASLWPLSLLINFCTREWARAGNIKLVNVGSWAFWRAGRETMLFTVSLVLSFHWFIYAVPDSCYHGW